jgi:hypothetical protein
MTERCQQCKKKGKMQDWCDKYHENRNYCITTCIEDHQDCIRDNPEIKQLIKNVIREAK